MIISSSSLQLECLYFILLVRQNNSSDDVIKVL